MLKLIEISGEYYNLALLETISQLKDGTAAVKFTGIGRVFTNQPIADFLQRLKEVYNDSN